MTSTGKTKTHIINLTRRRLISNFINMLVAPFFIFGPMFLIMYLIGIKELQYGGFIALFVSIIIFILGIILQFGVFVILTNGYTVGGFIMRLKIVQLDGEKLKLWKMVQRFLSSWNQLYKFVFYSHTKVNTLGQFYYDEIFQTTIISSSENIPEVSNIEYLEYNYAKEFLIFFIVFLFISKFINWISGVL